MLGRFLYAVTSTDVFAAELAGDGRPTNWISLGSRPGFGGSSSIALQSADGRSGFLYVTGGGETMSGNPGTCWVARLSGDGAMTAFEQTTSLEPGPKYHSSVAAGGHVYVAGGLWWSGGSFTGVGSDLPFVSVADVGAGGKLGRWRRTAMLPWASSGWRLAAARGHLYALGFEGKGIEVLVGDLDAGGGVQTWRRASAQLAHPFTRVALAADSGRLYVLGGTDFERVTNAVAIGRIGDDGDVVGWELSETDRFAGPRSDAVVAAGGGHLYLVGGNGFFAHPSTGAFQETQWATIDPATGHLSPLPEATAPRPPGAPLRPRAVARDSGAFVSWDPPDDDGGSEVEAYIVTSSLGDARVEVGGSATSATIAGLRYGSSYRFDVAARNRAGTGLGSGPSERVVPWPSARWKPATVMGSLLFVRRAFIVGEELFARDINYYLAAPFGADGLPWGQIGPGWQGDTSNSFPRFEAAVPRSVGKDAACMYYVGGSDPTGFTIGTTRTDCVEADGFRGKWLIAPTIRETFAPTRREGTAIVLDPFLYIAGGIHRDQAGQIVLADVSFARFSENWAVTAWTTTAALPEPIAAPVIAAHGNSLYLVAPPSSPSAILRAVVNSDGSLDGWHPSGAALPAGRTGARAAVLGDFLYVVAGGDAGVPSVLVGRFDASGSVASWEADSTESLADPVVDLLAIPGRLYLRNTAGIQLARVNPATGRLMLWR